MLTIASDVGRLFDTGVESATSTRVRWLDPEAGTLLVPAAPVGTTPSPTPVALGMVGVGWFGSGGGALKPIGKLLVEVLITGPGPIEMPPPPLLWLLAPLECAAGVVEVPPPGVVEVPPPGVVEVPPPGGVELSGGAAVELSGGAAVELSGGGGGGGGSATAIAAEPLVGARQTQAAFQL
jgi:hypothetical protein